MIRIFPLLIITLLVGCDSENHNPSTAGGPDNSTNSTPVEKDPPKEDPPITFNSFEEALSGLKTAAGDQKKVSAAVTFLSSQGEEAIPQLVAEMNNDENDLATRVYVCAALGSIGASAEKELIAALDNQVPQIRYRAAKGLGQIKPSSSEIVTKLIESMKHEDVNTRREVVLALERIGTSAKRAAKPLNDMLNDLNENETVRDAAKRALKSVNPRRTFED